MIVNVRYEAKQLPPADKIPWYVKVGASSRWGSYLEGAWDNDIKYEYTLTFQSDKLYTIEEITSSLDSMKKARGE